MKVAEITSAHLKQLTDDEFERLLDVVEAELNRRIEEDVWPEVEEVEV